MIAVALAKYCYFHGQVHGYYGGIAFPASIQSSLTDQLGEYRRGSSAAASPHRVAVNPAPPQYEALLLKNRPKPETISWVSLTDAGGGVDEIQDGGGE